MADEETTLSIHKFPNEILLYLFQFFDVRSLVVSRQVCVRWRDLIDDVLNSDNVWESNCLKDFPLHYQQAKRQSPYCDTWYEIYKSLSLWKHLDTAKESIDEFSHSTTVADEIRGLKLLDKGLLCIHKRTSVVYCDLITQDISPARPLIEGDFTRVYEHGDVFVLHGIHLDLSVLRWKYSPGDTNYERQELVAMFHHIKLFIMHENKIYFVNQENQVCSFGVYHETPLAIYPNNFDTSIVALSICDGLLHAITVDRTISTYLIDKFIPKLKLDSGHDIFHTLWEHNFLESLDWRMFYIWMTQIGDINIIPDGPMRFICCIRIYGDLVLVGTQCGLLRIYYKPFIDGKLNLIDSQPLKQFNFSQRIDIPVLSLQPIIMIEVVEARHGHKILVAMPKKILQINLSHDNETCVSQALLPYKKWDMKSLVKPKTENVEAE